MGLPRIAGWLAGMAVCLLGAEASAQYAERAGMVGSGRPDCDASGRSVKAPRIRAVHSDDPAELGGTAHLIEADPFLAYQLGRDLNFREFRSRDGIFSLTTPTGVGGLIGPMVDGKTAKITANNHTSCLGCHNVPNGNPGGGANFAKDSGLGRNSPHYYGGGLLEMLAIQIRTEIMGVLDTNGDGWISVTEARASPADLFIEPTPGAAKISFGSGRLDGDGTGRPRFNPIFRVWYGALQGGRIAVQPTATRIDGSAATHYNFEMVVFGWGQRRPPAGLNPTLRAFYWDPANTHGGLLARDPATLDDADGDGVSAPTLAGAIQFPATHRAPDPGQVLVGPPGFEHSADDPDRDGHLEEITEGDLDLAEWFMLNAPRPAFAGTPYEFARGLRVMRQMGCTSCHVDTWTLRPADGTFTGDRRFFDLDVQWRESSHDEQRASGLSGHLEGRLVELFTRRGAARERMLGAFTEDALFTDFRQHEMGEGFAELAYDGSRVTVWRTAPLWGVGSGLPWGHDGASLTLEHVILRHGGEARASRDAFAAAGRSRRAQLTDFLEKFVLYDIESLPSDLDGNGSITGHFTVAGQDTGTERFNAEWLFARPVAIQGEVANPDGVTIRSFAAANLASAYRLDEPLRADSDADGWPDVMDQAPSEVGYRDGVE